MGKEQITNNSIIIFYSNVSFIYFYKKNYHLPSHVDIWVLAPFFLEEKHLYVCLCVSVHLFWAVHVPNRYNYQSHMSSDITKVDYDGGIFASIWYEDASPSSGKQQTRVFLWQHSDQWKVCPDCCSLHQGITKWSKAVSCFLFHWTIHQ